MSTSASVTLPCDILVVGAGIAGAALACAVRERGYSVVQVEMSGTPLDTARGDHLQCVVAEILDFWGALPAFFAAGAEKRHGALYVTTEGAPLLEVTYTGLSVPHPYYVYLNHERIAETFLSLAAENSNYTLFRPARAREFETCPQGIRSLTIKLPEDAAPPAGYAPGQSVTIVPRMVVGADGRGSRVREALDILYDAHDYNNPLVVLFAPRQEDDPLNRVKSFMGPHGTLSRIPRVGGHWKVGLTIAKDDIAFWKTATPKMRRAAVTRRAAELESLETEVAGFYPVRLLNTKRWSVGNTVLVGDACHAMHPARGQGMNIAIRCVAKLVDLLPEPADMADADLLARRLKAYESGVKPAIDKVLAENHARGEEMDAQSPEIIARTSAALRAIQDDPVKLHRYRLQSAGYADPLGTPGG